MIKINTINSLYDNIKNLYEKNYVNDIELDTKDIKSDNYYIHNGYHTEKYIFINLINNNNLDIKDFLNSNNYYYDNYELFATYYNKKQINNPNNDYFLNFIKVKNQYDIINNFVCDINISKILNNNYIKSFCILSLLRNLYYYITTDEYYNKYDRTNDTYYFKIPLKYEVEKSGTIYDTNYNIFIEFNAKKITNNITITFINYENMIELIELLKPILHYHLSIILKDIKLVLKDSVLLTSKRVDFSYCYNISKVYDLLRFDSITKIIDLLSDGNDYYNKFNDDIFKYIKINSYKFLNISPINKTLEKQTDYHINANKLDKLIVYDPNYYIHEIINEPNKVNNNEDDDIKTITSKPVKDIIIVEETQEPEKYFDDLEEQNEELNNINKILYYKTITKYFIFFLSVINISLIIFLFRNFIYHNYDTSLFRITDYIIIIMIIAITIAIICLIILYNNNYLFNFKENFTGNEDIEQLIKDVSSYTEEKTTEEKQMEEITQKIEKTVNNIAELTEVVNELEIEHLDIETAINSSEKSLSLSDDKTNELEKERKNIEDSMKSLEEFITTQTNSVDELKKRSQEAKNDNDRIKDTTISMTNQLKESIKDIETKLLKTSSTDFQHLRIRVDTQIPYDFGSEVDKETEKFVVEAFVDYSDAVTQEDIEKRYQRIELDNKVKNYYSGMEYKDLEILLNEYNLSKHIKIKENLIELNSDLSQLLQSNIKEIQEANLKDKTDIMIEKFKENKHIIIISEILLAINTNNLLKNEIKEKVEEKKLEDYLKDYQDFNHERDTVNLNIETQKELRNKILENIELYKTNLSKIESDLQKINENIKENDEKIDSYNRYYDKTFDKLQQINLENNTKKIKFLEDLKNLQIQELINLQIFHNDTSIKLVKNLFNIDENKDNIIIDEYNKEIKSKYDLIETKYKNQVKLFTKLKQENVKLELLKINLESSKSSIESNEKILSENTLIFSNNIKRIKELIANSEKNKIKKEIILSSYQENLDKKEKEKIDIDENNTNELEIINTDISNLNDDIQKIKLEIEKIDQDLIKFDVDKQKILKIKDESIVKFKQEIDKTKHDYEMLLIQENNFLKKYNYICLKLTNTIDDIKELKNKLKIIMIKNITLQKKNNNEYETKIKIIVNDSKYLAEVKNNIESKIEESYETMCILIQKIDNEYVCTKENIGDKILQLFGNKDNNLIITKIKNIKSEYDILNNKLLNLNFIIIKYKLDIFLHLIIFLIKNINLYDQNISLETLNLKIIEYEIIYKNVYIKTLENEKIRLLKTIDYLTYKNFNLKQLYHSYENNIENANIKKKLSDKIDANNKLIINNNIKIKSIDENINLTKKKLEKVIDINNKQKNKHKYFMDSIIDNKYSKIKLTIDKLKSYHELIEEYMSYKDIFVDENKKEFLNIFVPKKLDNKYKKNLYYMYEDNKENFIEYIKNDNYNNINELIKDITTIVTIDEKDSIEYCKILLKLTFKYDISDTFDRDSFKYNIIEHVSTSLNIDSELVNISSMNLGDETFINMNIKINEKYKTPQEIFDELLKQVNDPDSILKREEEYVINEVINNIEKIEEKLESKIRECNEPIRFPSYISDNAIGGDYFNEIFKYCNTDKNRHLLLLYLPLITNEKPDKTTLYDYSIYNRTLYEAICDTYINKIYKNYIELKNTLLKVDNISLYRNEYTISFICKLSKNKKQHVLLSNGKIHEMLDIGKINWQEYKTSVNEYFKNYNILSIGFCDNKLYMQLPCENNTKTNIITSEDNELRIDDDIWAHWIIVKKLNNIKIYKNLQEIKNFTVEYDTIMDEQSCYTSKFKYDKKTLYIGGIKTDIDNNTKDLNNIISFEGGLRDLRIYEVALEKDDIDNIFITNCTPEKEQVIDTEETIGQQPEYTDDQLYQDGSYNDYTGDRDQYDVTQEPEYKEENGSYTITDEIGGCYGIDKKVGYINEDGSELLRKVCIKNDTKPCFKYNSLDIIDKINNTKFCYTNDENIHQGFVNISNKKNSGKFNKAKEKLKEKNMSYLNNFGCESNEKLIFVEDLNRWECEKTDFSCYDETYNYQLPFKNIQNDYECISEYNNGVIINDKNKYEEHYLFKNYYTYDTTEYNNEDHDEYFNSILKR